MGAPVGHVQSVVKCNTPPQVQGVGKLSYTLHASVIYTGL